MKYQHILGGMLSCALAIGAFSTSPVLAAPSSVPLSGPLSLLQTSLDAVALAGPGQIGVAVEELSTHSGTSVNGAANMPAASVIKIPVMVEVFRQMQAGHVTLTQVLDLRQHDRDWGWGDLADAPTGSKYTVERLLRLMITESDNTATNMLIRLVGRENINATMRRLGLMNTRLGDDIRSTGDIRSLRTSPQDMVHLLDQMAHEHLIDAWSSREMVAILVGQQHNGLLPQPLPRGLEIAHKTGTLHDTLNDVGIVFLGEHPYAIAVMTTNLPSLDTGRAIIHNISRLAYSAFVQIASASTAPAIPTAPEPQTIEAPDTQMWTSSAASDPALSSDASTATAQTDASDDRPEDGTSDPKPDMNQPL